MSQLTLVSKNVDEIWVRTPLSYVIIGEKEDKKLMDYIAKNSRANIYLIPQREGYEYLLMDATCICRNGEIIEEEFELPDDIEAFMAMIGASYACVKNGTLYYNHKNAHFDSQYIQKVLTSEYNYEKVVRNPKQLPQNDIEVVYEYTDARKTLAERCKELGIDKVYALHSLPHPRILVVNKEGLRVDDLYPETSLVIMDNAPYGYFLVYEGGKFVNARHTKQGDKRTLDIEQTSESPEQDG